MACRNKPSTIMTRVNAVIDNNNAGNSVSIVIRARIWIVTV